MGRVVCRAEVALVLESAVSVGWVEVHLCLTVASMYVDTLQCHFGTEGIRTCGF
jgi:hypothetical protein